MRPTPDIRARARRYVTPVAIALVAGLAVVLPGLAVGSSQSTSVTVSMTIASHVSLTDNCRQRSAWDLGDVLPGSVALTATDANVCSFSFQSNNDTAMLRIGQADRQGTAMSAPGTTSGSQQTPHPWGMDVFDSNTFWAAGFGSAGTGWYWRSIDGGANWSFGQIGAVTFQARDIAAANDADSAIATSFNTDDIYYTTDAGLNWSGVSTGGGRMYGVDAIGLTAYAVGESGTILRSTDGGASWSAPLTSNTAETLWEVSMYDTSTIYAVGNNGAVTRSTDGGLNWSAQTVGAGSNRNFVDVVATGATQAWLAGGANGVKQLWKTDDGSTWNSKGWFPSNSQALGSITAQDTSTAVVTVDGADPKLFDADDAMFANTADGGDTWIDRDEFRGAHCSTSARVGVDHFLVICAGMTVFESTDAGVTWSRIYNDGSALNGATVLDNSTTALAVGTSGVIDRSTDGGTTWNRLATGLSIDFDLNDVEGRDGNVVAVGSNGSIARSTDDGVTWTSVASGTANHLFAVTAVDDNSTFWASGENGTILYSDDAGATWASQPSGTAAHLKDITAADALTAWASGNTGTTLIKTSNGGTTWNPTASAPNGIITVDAWDGQYVFAATQGNMHRSTDGGDTWVAGASGLQVYGGDIEAVSPDIAWLRQRFGFAHTRDGGATYTLHSGGGRHSTAMAPIGANNAIHVGPNDEFRKATESVAWADYDGVTATWASGAMQELFGVCLQAIGGSAIADWTVDTGGTAGLCEASDADDWRDVPAALSKVVHTTVAGNAGSADFVFGAKVPSDAGSGVYASTITFEAVAPNL